MGNNCEKQAIENFGIHSISYLYYFYQHTTTHEACVRSVTCKQSQSKQRKVQTQFLDLAATSLLAQPRKICPDYKAQMLEPSQRTVLS